MRTTGARALDATLVCHPSKMPSGESGDRRGFCWSDSIRINRDSPFCHASEHTRRNGLDTQLAARYCDLCDLCENECMSTPWIAQDEVPLDTALGERVHQLMWRAKISQTALAPKLGLTQAGLSKKLRGDRGWSLDEVLAVSDLFGVSLNYLFGREDQNSPSGPNQRPTD